MPQDTRINNSRSNEARQQSKIHRRAQSSMGELGQMLFGNSTAVINSNQLLSDNEQQPFARDSEIGVSIANSMICSDIWHKYHE